MFNSNVNELNLFLLKDILVFSIHRIGQWKVAREKDTSNQTLSLGVWEFWFSPEMCYWCDSGPFARSMDIPMLLFPYLPHV